MNTLIATLIPSRPETIEMLIFCALGFGVVMFVLAVLSIATSFVGMPFKFLAKKNEAPKPSVSKAANIVSVDGSKISSEHEFVVSAAVAAMLPELQAGGGELLAVISAAATVALGDDCRIVSYKQVPDMSYARQGREQIYASKSFIPRRG